MKRSRNQWLNCNPKAMAFEMSQVAQQRAFEDAKSDILELLHENEQMRQILRPIAYPRRGTAEDNATIFTAAEAIQAKWTLHDLDK